VLHNTPTTKKNEITTFKTNVRKQNTLKRPISRDFHLLTKAIFFEQANNSLSHLSKIQWAASVLLPMEPTQVSASSYG